MARIREIFSVSKAPGCIKSVWSTRELWRTSMSDRLWSVELARSTIDMDKSHGGNAQDVQGERNCHYAHQRAVCEEQVNKRIWSKLKLQDRHRGSWKCRTDQSDVLLVYVEHVCEIRKKWSVIWCSECVLLAIGRNRYLKKTVKSVRQNQGKEVIFGGDFNYRELNGTEIHGKKKRAGLACMS